MGAYTRTDKRAVERGLERVQAHFPILAERRLQLAGTLSGGEQQILAIGRALMAAPRLMLLDEQNANKALSIADCGYVLETGTVSLAGDSLQLLRDDNVRRSYLGHQKR